jgi:hypothetical protein
MSEKSAAQTELHLAGYDNDFAGRAGNGPAFLLIEPAAAITTGSSTRDRGGCPATQAWIPTGYLIFIGPGKSQVSAINDQSADIVSSSLNIVLKLFIITFMFIINILYTYLYYINGLPLISHL